jgi:hypothetical protein
MSWRLGSRAAGRTRILGGEPVHGYQGCTEYVVTLLQADSDQGLKQRHFALCSGYSRACQNFVEIFYSRP